MRKAQEQTLEDILANESLADDPPPEPCLAELNLQAESFFVLEEPALKFKGDNKDTSFQKTQDAVKHEFIPDHRPKSSQMEYRPRKSILSFAATPAAKAQLQTLKTSLLSCLLEAKLVKEPKLNREKLVRILDLNLDRLPTLLAETSPDVADVHSQKLLNIGSAPLNELSSAFNPTGAACRQVSANASLSVQELVLRLKEKEFMIAQLVSDTEKHLETSTFLSEQMNIYKTELAQERSKLAQHQHELEERTAGLTKKHDAEQAQLVEQSEARSKELDATNEALKKRLAITKSALDDKIRQEESQGEALLKERKDQLLIYRNIRHKYLELHKKFVASLTRMNSIAKNASAEVRTFSSAALFSPSSQRNSGALIIRNEQSIQKKPLASERIQVEALEAETVQHFQVLVRYLERERSQRIQFETQNLVHRNKLDQCLKQNIQLSEELDVIKLSVQERKQIQKHLLRQQLQTIEGERTVTGKATVDTNSAQADSAILKELAEIRKLRASRSQSMKNLSVRCQERQRDFTETSGQKNRAYDSFQTGRAKNLWH